MTFSHHYVGFGFGPIQSALFAAEADASGKFASITISEVDQKLVDAVRRAGDGYTVNIARQDGMERLTIHDVRLLNPTVPSEAGELRAALRKATEIVTALPSVAFFTRGGDTAVAQLLAATLPASDAPATLVYTAENNNRAAEILEQNVATALGTAKPGRPVQYLNTVIGKMSQVVKDEAEIARAGLAPIAPGFPRAILVEAFNHIQITRVTIPGFVPGISVFEEKDDLLPFEEAKLFGHNAIHAVLGFLGRKEGETSLSALRGKPEIMGIARKAFLDEIGPALQKKYGSLGDKLFTAGGWKRYAEDLLARITNPFLADTVERAVRDPVRKLGPDDRIFGAIRLCLRQGIQPVALLTAARAALEVLPTCPGCPPEVQAGPANSEEADVLLALLWGEGCPAEERRRLAKAIFAK